MGPCLASVGPHDTELTQQQMLADFGEHLLLQSVETNSARIAVPTTMLRGTFHGRVRDGRSLLAHDLHVESGRQTNDLRAQIGID